MIEQQFGTIEIDGIEHVSMLCWDEDEPTEAMIYFWSDGEPPQGVLLRLTHLNDTFIEIRCTQYFKTDQNYNFYQPHLKDHELEELLSSHGQLNKIEGGFEGWWRGPSRGGTIRLSPIKPIGKLEPTVCRTWNEFKTWATETRTQYDTVCYRGHCDNDFELRTSFHRTNRQRLERFHAKDLSIFHDHAQTQLNRIIDINNPMEKSSLLALAQHHGLPTPLLDVTRSPYIAAFFAFSDLLDDRERSGKDKFVRIYAFTRGFIEASSPPMVQTHFPRPYICRLRVSGINNPRLNAQQGEFLITNIVNIEAALMDIEYKSGQKAVLAADIHYSCAIEVLEDLSFMGLTAATLFPGLDGICRMLRHQSHFKRPLLETAEEAKSSLREPNLTGGLGKRPLSETESDAPSE